MAHVAQLVRDGQGRLFVKSNDIMVFDGDGRYLDTINTVSVAFSMAFNDQNQLVVMACNDNQVIVYELNR
ncbi:MAG TPA: hypothetical protein DEP47_05435 [Chloroflexi bacterium]|nr:hypothetical protein [Chloroflexota bacterium]